MEQVCGLHWLFFPQSWHWLLEQLITAQFCGLWPSFLWHLMNIFLAVEQHFSRFSRGSALSDGSVMQMSRSGVINLPQTTYCPQCWWVIFVFMCTWCVTYSTIFRMELKMEGKRLQTKLFWQVGLCTFTLHWYTRCPHTHIHLSISPFPHVCLSAPSKRVKVAAALRGPQRLSSPGCH